MNPTTTTTVALIDDHVLLRNALASIIESFGGFSITLQASHGADFIDQLNAGQPDPELVILDVNMPVMDGFATANWISLNRPHCKIVVLSMLDGDSTIIRMLRSGAKGYILKDSSPEVLEQGLRDVVRKGMFVNAVVNQEKLIQVGKMGQDDSPLDFSEQEIDFIRQCCSDLGYKEIAAAMNLPLRVVEFMRKKVFEKMDVNSRVGLVMFALRNGLCTVQGVGKN